MYFLILLSLVLTVFKLASMQTNPFDEYTWREKQYLQLVTNFHKVSITGKIKLILDDFILRISKRKSNVSEGKLNIKILIVNIEVTLRIYSKIIRTIYL